MIDHDGNPLCPACGQDALSHALRDRNPQLSTRPPIHQFRRRGDVEGVDGFLQTWGCEYCIAEFTVPLRASASTMAAALRRMLAGPCPMPPVAKPKAGERNARWRREAR